MYKYRTIWNMYDKVPARYRVGGRWQKIDLGFVYFQFNKDDEELDKNNFQLLVEELSLSRENCSF